MKSAYSRDWGEIPKSAQPSTPERMFHVEQLGKRNDVPPYRWIPAPDGDGFTIQERVDQLDGDYHWQDLDWAETQAEAEKLVEQAVRYYEEDQKSEPVRDLKKSDPNVHDGLLIERLIQDVKDVEPCLGCLDQCRRTVFEGQLWHIDASVNPPRVFMCTVGVSDYVLRGHADYEDAAKGRGTW
jgi:hypothetical protein